MENIRSKNFQLQFKNIPEKQSKGIIMIIPRVCRIFRLWQIIFLRADTVAMWAAGWNGTFKIWMSHNCFMCNHNENQTPLFFLYGWQDIDELKTEILKTKTRSPGGEQTKKKKQSKTTNQTKAS